MSEPSDMEQLEEIRRELDENPSEERLLALRQRVREIEDRSFEELRRTLADMRAQARERI